MGDTEPAARVAAIAAPNVVVTAEGTRRLIGNLFDLEEVRGKEPKGTERPVRPFAALRPNSIESRFDTLRTAMMRPSAATRRWRCSCGAGRRPRPARARSCLSPASLGIGSLTFWRRP